jgi:hypothetical protein
MKTRLPFIALLTALAAVGCDEAPNPIAPSGSVLTISASPARIAPNGESNVTVTGFRPDGNRLNPGTQIRLTASLGTLSSSLLEIGADGYATTVLRGDGRVGDATIKAQLTTGETAAEVIVKVDAPKPTLLVIPSATEVDPSTDDDTVEVPVTLIARDENALPMGAGHTILLSASLGSFAKNGRAVTSVQTESDGRATVDFVVGDQPGEAKITAILGSSDPATATITIRDVETQFTFTADRFNVSTDEEIDLTVNVRNAEGRPAQGIVVTFRSDAVDGTFNPASATTNSLGVVNSTFTYEDNLPAGTTFRLFARAGALPEQSITITVR